MVRMGCVCIRGSCLFSIDDIGSVYGSGMCMRLNPHAVSARVKYFNVTFRNEEKKLFF